MIDSEGSRIPATPSGASPEHGGTGFESVAEGWVPVARRQRADGWSPAAQRRFIEILAETGSVAEAAAGVRKSVTSCYRLRRVAGAEGFAAAWQAALAQGVRSLGELALERVANSDDEPIFDRDGNCIHVRRRINDRLLMFLLRTHDPDRYRLD